MVSSGNTTPLKAEAHPSIWPVIMPLALGVSTFAIYMWASSVSGFGILAPSPFKGIDLVYAMILSSFVTVATATYFYLEELETMMLSAAALGGGHDKIRWARRIIILTTISIVVVTLWLLVAGILYDQKACEFDAFLRQAKIHDAFVGSIFAVFVVADFITYSGLKETIAVSPLGSKERAHAEANKEFVVQQLWLIDIPVLTGAIGAVLVVLFASGANSWDASLLHPAPQIEDFMERTRLQYLFSCDSQQISFPEFQQSIVHIFSAGIAMGYLAAHVLMSQFVFIALSFLHRRKVRTREHLLIS